MLGEALTALAAAGGTAVVQAAGTSAWQGLQQALAGWFGQGDQERERALLERLDDTSVVLAAASDAELERTTIGQQAVWQARFETVLEQLRESEREQSAEALRVLLNTHTGWGASAGDGGAAVSGRVDIRADHGSAAALRMGDVTINNPLQPGPHEG
ncbi:hypothetical protein OG357_33915 [Streptomyces sp. NBC_01255]|uniref:hypothetical protein n=1 Tax=Streptomyces sp. NBC_01255 TaxID=2903798 RepID=UPI002E2FDFAA|nr:hypothetical protein [Streptomyces sp. NBC_01255]